MVFRKRKFLIFIFTLLIFSVNALAQLNLAELSHVTFPGQRTAGVWHYVDPNNREYALVGTERGLSIVDVTNPVLPEFVLQVPGISNAWREVKTWENFAYVTTEGRDPAGINDGLQIIDLSHLPDSAPAHYWQGDGAIANQLHKAHSLTISEGYVYINGHNITSLNGGVLIADLVDPVNPHYVGAITANYCHDSYVRGDTLWASEIRAGQFAVYDISDRSNPLLLATQTTPGSFNHNTWLSDDGNVLFTTDEVNHAPLASFDVTDLSNIELLDKYKVDHIVSQSNSDEVHNVRVLNDFLVNACYGSQVTIVDAARPDNLIEVGNFPISSTISWDVDPFLPSGKILATGKTAGLFVLDPTYTRACYLEGNVTDSSTGLPLINVLVKIISTNVNGSTGLTGEYKTGYYLQGNYDIEYSKPLYRTKLITNVPLANGLVTRLDVQLAPVVTVVNELDDDIEVSVFPNPFNDVARMEISEHLLARYHSVDYVLKDVTGRKLKEINGVSVSPVMIYNENLSSGIYFYELKSDARIIAKGKLVIK